jgi:hypothetical protein
MGQIYLSSKSTFTGRPRNRGRTTLQFLSGFCIIQ